MLDGVARDLDPPMLACGWSFQCRHQFLAGYPRLIEDAGQGAEPKIAADGNDAGAPIPLQHNMTSSLPNLDKTQPFERADGLTTVKPRQPRHGH